MGEFDLIARYFTRPAQRALLGVGDDCALLQPRPGTQLAISSDMLVADRHFFSDVKPESLGHKALAVNLSDLAACGARPLAFTLAISLPQVDEPWLADFSRGLWALADAHNCELIGGDTTQGPLNICITVFGETEGQPLLRSPLEPWRTWFAAHDQDWPEPIDGSSFNIPPGPPPFSNSFDRMTCSGCHDPSVSGSGFTHARRDAFSPFLINDLVQRRTAFRDALLNNFCQ
jgi:hypothetical protein